MNLNVCERAFVREKKTRKGFQAITAEMDGA